MPTQHTIDPSRLYLLPMEDPNAKLSTYSSSGVLYQDVLDGIHRLYPTVEYADRNALSRSSGYWPYIRNGDEPPIALTYGEFDMPFFAEILDRAIQPLAGKTFCDIGSGTGRLVVSAAALHPQLALARGVEYLESCHDYAVKMQWRCRQGLILEDGRSLPMAPMDFTHGSIGDPNTYIGDVDVAFVSSSAMPPQVLEMISKAVGKQCKVGTIVVSTDYEIPREGIVDGLPYKFELIEVVDGYCWIVGGTSTAYFYRLIQSCSTPTISQIDSSSGSIVDNSPTPSPSVMNPSLPPSQNLLF
jgi:hypothetical protein